MPHETSNPVILLVNDYETVIDRWKRRAVEAAPNARILEATSAYEAEQQIHQHKPDVVVLDVSLPESEFNPYLREWGDMASYSSRVGEIYRKECPEGQLIV